jgi:hypothetical protein
MPTMPPFPFRLTPHLDGSVHLGLPPADATALLRALATALGWGLVPGPRAVPDAAWDTQVVATFLYRTQQAVRWACAPDQPWRVVQQRWTERDVLGPLVDYLLCDATGATAWALEPDVGPWDMPQPRGNPRGAAPGPLCDHAPQGDTQPSDPGEAPACTHDARCCVTGDDGSSYCGACEAALRG